MYTERKSKKINSQIQDHLDIIKKNVRSRLNLRSIVLIGTYSRGEGAVFVSNKAAIPANDYDLYLIVDKHPSENLIFELQEKCVRDIKEYILKKTKNENLLRGFNVDFKCLTPNEIKDLPPFLRFYEMKGIKAIHGKNYAHLIPEYKSIPLSEGLRWIFNDASHIFDYISDRNFDAKVNYFLSKTYLSMATSFLVYKKDLDVSIIGKNKKINKYNLPIRNFHKKLEKYTSFRLNPREKGNFKSNFFEVQKDFKVYFRFYLLKFFEIKKEDSWIDISRKIKKELYKNYYAPYLRFYFKKYFKINPPRFLLNTAAYFAQYYFSFKFAIHLKNLKKPYFKTFFQKDPGILIIASLPLLFFSIKKKGSDVKMLKELDKNLNKIISSRKSINWEELKLKYTKIYKLYFWQKFI